jgi:molybdopterin-biosynthesis enzyme MoeA-like protein
MTGGGVLKPGVVTVGDELVFGERGNDNEKWLLGFLRERGYPAVAALCLPDDVSAIAFWVRALVEAQHFPVLVSGGIGGTHDDCTREGIASALGRPLVKHEECFRILQSRYGRRFNQERRRMAWLPEDCGLIANPYGAPGFHMQGIFAFPGFPDMLHVMAPEALDGVLPERSEALWTIREHVLPVAEGDIAEAVEEFLRNHPGARLGMYPDATRMRREVTLRLRFLPGQEETAAAFDALVEELRSL